MLSIASACCSTYECARMLLLSKEVSHSSDLRDSWNHVSTTFSKRSECFHAPPPQPPVCGPAPQVSWPQCTRNPYQSSCAPAPASAFLTHSNALNIVVMATVKEAPTVQEAPNRSSCAPTPALACLTHTQTHTHTHLLVAHKHARQQHGVGARVGRHSLCSFTRMHSQDAHHRFHGLLCVRLFVCMYVCVLVCVCLCVCVCVCVFVK